jgi:hypothetical protein
VAGDLANPDGDAFVNLLEYALGLEPLGADEPAPPVLVAGRQNDHLTFTYRRRSPPTDIGYEVQAGSDLSAWSALGISEEILGDDGTFQLIEATDPEPLGADPQRFMRLNVTPPAP